MKLDDVFAIGGNAFGYVLAAVQQNEILQIISFALSTVTSVIIIAFKIWAWWKKAKADGKISKEEIDELHDIIDESRKDK